MVILSFIAFIVLCLLIDAVVHAIKRKKAESIDAVIEKHGIFDEKSISVPLGVFFDKGHTWAFMDKNGMVKVGINDFLQKVTGKINRVEMVQAGEKIKKGDPVITIIQEGKRLIINTPLSGKIVAKNTLLTTNADVVNTSPYNDGWIYKIEPDNWLKETRFMMMAEKAKEWVHDEMLRLKDFLAVTLSRSNGNIACHALQDGGELTSNVLSSLGPELWEEFQANFINKAG